MDRDRQQLPCEEWTTEDWQAETDDWEADMDDTPSRDGRQDAAYEAGRAWAAQARQKDLDGFLRVWVGLGDETSDEAWWADVLERFAPPPAGGRRLKASDMMTLPLCKRAWLDGVLEVRLGRRRGRGRLHGRGPCDDAGGADRFDED